MPKETSGPTLMKDRISPDVVTHLADLLSAASESFRRETFLADVTVKLHPRVDGDEGEGAPRGRCPQPQPAGRFPPGGEGDRQGCSSAPPS